MDTDSSQRIGSGGHARGCHKPCRKSAKHATKVDSNRAAQQRFRERQKTHLAELESKVAEGRQKLASVTSEVDKLEVRAGQLMHDLAMRASALEALRSEQKSKASGSEVDPADYDAVGALAALLHDNLTLTVREGAPRVLTLADIKALDRDQLVATYQEYVGHLAPALVEVDTNGSAAALERIARLTDELVMLWMRVGLVGAYAFKLYLATRLDDADAKGEEGEEDMRLWLHIAHALRLTPAQRTHIVQLCRSSLQRVAVIYEQRRVMLARLEAALPRCRLLRLSGEKHFRTVAALADLHTSLCEERQVRLDWTGAIFKNVLTPLQLARLLVGSGPWHPDPLAIAAWVAAEEGDPMAMSTLMGNHKKSAELPSAQEGSICLPASGPAPVAFSGRTSGGPPSRQASSCDLGGLGSTAAAVACGRPALPATDSTGSLGSAAAPFACSRPLAPAPHSTRAGSSPLPLAAAWLGGSSQGSAARLQPAAGLQTAASHDPDCWPATAETPTSSPASVLPSAPAVGTAWSPPMREAAKAAGAAWSPAVPEAAKGDGVLADEALDQAHDFFGVQFEDLVLDLGLDF